MVESKVISTVDYGVFVRIRDGVEGLISTGDLVEGTNEDGTPKPLKIGDEVKAEIANIDSQDRRLTLSMRIGENASTSPTRAASTSGTAGGGEKRESKAPKKGTDEASKGGTIGELIKQKLGQKLGMEKEEAVEKAPKVKKAKGAKAAAAAEGAEATEEKAESDDAAEPEAATEEEKKD